MDFEVTNEQKDIKRSRLDFAEKMFPKVAQECQLNDHLKFNNILKR